VANNSVHISEILNRMAARLPCIDKTDLSILGAIYADFELLSTDELLPRALRSTAQRAVKLANLIIMGETDFDAGCFKLGECIANMMKGNNSEAVAAANDIKPRCKTVEEGVSTSQSPTDNLNDLLEKFAAQQQNVLENFELFILNLDKGDEQAMAPIKRILHTWKGEFGVLGLAEYSGLIHLVEEALENDACSTDNLLKLKDFLCSRVNMLAAGSRPDISPDEIKNILGGSEAANDPIAPEMGADMPTGDNTITPDSSLLADFIAESRDHIHTAETLLLKLETDPTNAENLNSIFRSWHTIKGVAGFVGLIDVATLSHSMENLMAMARKGDLVLTPGHIDVLLEATDCMKELIAIVERTLAGDEYHVPLTFSAVMAKLAFPLAPLFATVPTEPEFLNRKIGEILVAKGVASPLEISNAVAQQEQGDTRKLGEILIDKKEVPARNIASALAAQAGARQGKAVEESIRVPINRLDQLIDAIGEAVIAQSMIFADSSARLAGDQVLDKKLANATLIMRQIQELSMSLRMVSIKATFQKMARLVRDLSKKVNKEVNLVTEGEDTELDKSVVENIGDPLIHMVRNALDHGFESAEERTAKGKPAAGRLCLKAYHKAGNIFIDIEDDGRGLDLEAIRAKAIQKGLCKAEDNYTEQEIYHFIFLPGFSTAKVVTDVSGRGVGMDVVRRNIEALRGSVDIHSELSRGTRFSIRLPLTLAIIDGMIVKVSHDTFIIPTLSIVESLKPGSNQLDSILGKGEIINVRGSLIPLVRLSTIFSGNRAHNDPACCIVMIVEDMLGKRVGLLVDEIVGQQQVVIKSLGDGLGAVPGVSGGAIMNDGTVSLILDISGIVRVATEHTVEEMVEV
jgi:two-component system, chemotaxis family, sensor kinase CheA